MVKAGDYVIVVGEANEVFEVDRIDGRSVILTTGWAEPINKCTPIPKKFHALISTTTTRHIGFDVMDMMEEDNETNTRI